MTQVASKNGLPDLIEEYMQAYFEANPVMASSWLGLHEYDGRLPDLSRESFDRRVAALKELQSRVEQLPVTQDKESHFDRELLLRSIRDELFATEDIRGHETNPMFYANLLDVSGYIKRDYAPLAERLEKMVRHLAQVPAVLEAARQHLETALAKPVLETSIGMYEGLISYYAQDVAASVAQANSPDLTARFEATSEQAVAAIRDFIQLLTGWLPQAHFNFAIGAEKYRRMLATGEMVDLPVEKVLEVGERNLADNLREMREVCEKIRPGATVQEIMLEVSKHHPTAESLVPDTRNKLEEVRQFLIDHQIVTVPSEVRCQVQETPPFMRWAFAFMDPPGPFETVATEAFYYLTPVEPEWTDQQKEEWLTKFDYYTLQDVSVHEAYPGHYLHFLHTQLVPQPFRKMVGAYSFVEGYAHYTEQMMLEEGYASEDLRYKVGQLVEALLRNCRYIASIKMHTKGMTVDEATRFLMENAFMEETPARSEAVRGTFDPGYLNYTLGKLLLLKLREDYKAEKGDSFNLQEFHDRVLAYGAPPIPLLRTVLLENDNGEIL
jgi:uncharacterized protein (DUF885 family)